MFILITALPTSFSFVGDSVLRTVFGLPERKVERVRHHHPVHAGLVGRLRMHLQEGHFYFLPTNGNSNVRTSYTVGYLVSAYFWLTYLCFDKHRLHVEVAVQNLSRYVLRTLIQILLTYLNIFSLGRLVPMSLYQIMLWYCNINRLVFSNYSLIYMIVRHS